MLASVCSATAFAWGYEFYACYDPPQRLDHLNAHIDAFAHLYNHHRPRGALAGRTPAEYLNIRPAKEAPPSHMS
jgi:transposase InsO family protein